MRGLVTSVATLIVACSAIVAQRPPDPADEVERGRELYGIYCRNCHGEGGRGDGPMVEVLTVRPTDLTRLGRPGDEGFPVEEVYATIDGRDEVLAHGARRMPVWGLAFQELDTDVDQEGQVRARILALVEYLKSIRAVPERKK